MIKSARYQMFAMLALLLLSNFILRFVIEMHLQPVPFYFEQLKINLSDAKWYTFMIPSNAKFWGGTWASLSIGLLPTLNRLVGNTPVYLLLNLLFITTGYGLSWYAFRSKILTFTTGLCLAFTTLNAHVYDNGSLVALYFPLIWCFFNLFTVFKLFEQDKPQHSWWILWAVSLLLYIASFEGWVEYYASIVIISPVMFFLLIKNKDSSRSKRLVQLLCFMTIAFILFLYIKIKYVYASNPGSEHDLIFNYGRHYWILMIEDIISNFFTFFYTTIITYLPAQLTFSNALMTYGPQALIEQQNGYDPNFAQLVAINALTIWRFYAGVLVAVFVYYFWQVCGRLFTTFNKDYLFLFIFMSMILISTPAHMFVKYRAFHMVPWLSYQTFIGQIGLILLISYSLFMLHKSNKSKKFIWTINIIVWSCVVVTAFTKKPFFQAGRAYGYVLHYNICNK